jgi:hypothetical protein
MIDCCERSQTGHPGVQPALYCKSGAIIEANPTLFRVSPIEDTLLKENSSLQSYWGNRSTRLPKRVSDLRLFGLGVCGAARRRSRYARNSFN